MPDASTPISCENGSSVAAESKLLVSVLTGGADRPYAFGLASSLMTKVAGLDLIVCDELDCPPFQQQPRVRLLNLRGSVDPNVSSIRKLSRVLVYYCRLIVYALSAHPKVFHILWNNKFESFDRTVLMLLYRFLGKKIVLTVHNVNKRQRDSRDSSFNRLTLRTQYRLADHLFVHTELMKQELVKDYGVSSDRVTVIPFGMNNSVPNTSLSSSEAKAALGVDVREKTLLFFGHITPYKGLEYLIGAFRELAAQDSSFKLILAGRPKDCDEYWNSLMGTIREDVAEGKIILQAAFVPDEDTEIYFKAADVLVLPYRYIYQSGVLFLGLSFGLPALVSDVGPLKEEIVEGESGFTFRSEDSQDLAKAIKRYFSSDLYLELPQRRARIRQNAEENHSWESIGKTTINIYQRVLKIAPECRPQERSASGVSIGA